jgi:hypothetical protein
MGFHIARERSGKILCCTASMASAFRPSVWQPRVAKHCLPIALAVRQRGRAGGEKFEETAG